MNADLPSAVLWDMDGTLVDTEPYWFEAQTELVESFGRTWTDEDGLALVGAGLWVSAEILQSKGVAWDADRIVHHLTDEVIARIKRSVPWRPGARELLRATRDAGIRTALVTMSIRSMATLVAEYVRAELDDDASVLEVIVTGEDVGLPKPHPEAYLTAAKQLGVDPADCVAVEDSPAGLASAVAAGTAAIAVPHVLPIEPGRGYTVWSTLDGRHVDDLRTVLADHRSERSSMGEKR